jgi:acylphosphatase
MKNNILQVRIFILGFVQGVGLRAFVKKHAEELGITGWVRNMPDGRVEALLQAKGKDAEERLEKLVRICQKGPFLAQVRDIVVEKEEAEEEFFDFEIRH